MFVTKRRLESELDYMRKSIDTMNDKYWAIYRAHQRLLSELGFTDEVVHEHWVLRKKGGPEKGP